MAQNERGINSTERRDQEEREKSTLGALYMTDAQIPESPAEPASQINEEETDVNVVHMSAGTEIQPFFASISSVADLVGQLRAASSSIGAVTGVAGGMPGTDLNMGYASSGGDGGGMQDVNMSNASVPPGSLDLKGLGVDPATIQALTQLMNMQMMQMPGQSAVGGAQPGQQASLDPSSWNYLNQQQQQQPPTQSYGPSSTSSRQLPGPYSDYGPGGYDDDMRGPRRDDGPGRRGGRGERPSRGGGRGGFRGRRKPCTFFAAGRRALNIIYFWFDLED